jgi:hypothetical protein
MPVSFAVLECESEGPKSPCAGGGSCLNKGLAWWRPLPAPLCFGRGPNKRRGPDYRITWPREIVARERRRALARRNVLIPRREGGVKAWRRSLM